MISFILSHKMNFIATVYQTMGKTVVTDVSEIASDFENPHKLKQVSTLWCLDCKISQTLIVQE